MKILKPAFLLFLISIFFYSCGPSFKVTGTWLNKEKLGKGNYKSVFVIAMTPNLEARQSFEDAVAEYSARYGVRAVKSLDVYGPITSKAALPSPEAFMAKVQELKCDAIFTVTLVDSKSETRYVPGTTSYTPYPTYGYYGSFGGYYGYNYGTVYEPGYYTTDQTYFLEGNLYDSSNEDILFSIQSKATNPPELIKSSKEYAATLFNELKKQGLISQTK
jgi:hypothetical protein